MKNTIRKSSLSLIGLLFLLTCPTPGEESPAPKLSPADSLKSTAEYYLQHGQPEEAAAAYEQLIQADPASSNIITALLVDVYIQANQPDKAMEKATARMASMPDPRAYLAQVYAQMNMVTEATAILEQEIQNEPQTNRVINLMLQLAAIQSNAGQTEKAMTTARHAKERAAGTLYESAADRMVEKISTKSAP